MIRTNRVKTMTRAAIFEKREERRALYISRFFISDYIGLGVLKSIISITFAFILGICAWAVYHAEDLEEMITAMTLEGLIELGEKTLGWYILVLAGFLAITVTVCIVRYQKAQKRLKGYRSHLRKLMKSYQEEGTAKEQTL